MEHRLACSVLELACSSGYSQAVATFYENPTSPGSGGACGLENDVASAPYNAMITAGNQALFKQGSGCGACYQVLCTQDQNPHCSGNSITVTLTDECPGVYNNDPVHFDISGIAFGKLAKSGEASQLYNAGRISIFYQRVACTTTQISYLRWAKAPILISSQLHLKQ
ncbi:PREDICTED: putative expansin-B2 [Nicotiana attenuata]|uniref:putative expansin-B2 n=1 Tax=Nicotiana attenuata TaxID=49451 RepID=UPI000904608D|nr:PREDICTED: putative expansin-B2 [Nicotiana attenuata]